MKDVLVLGAGSAGFYAALMCASKGLDVALIEKEGLGGTGFRFGALPVKILLDGIRENPGISFEELQEDFRKKMDEVRRKLEADLKEAGAEIILGEGCFVGRNAILVNRKVLEAKNIVIATGSRPANFPKVSYGNRILTHKEALALDRLPKDLLILGANVEGIEFAAIFARLGVKVTVVDMEDAILPGNDWDLKAPIIDMLKSLKVEFVTGCKVTGVSESQEGAEVTVVTGEKLKAERCLVCLSRLPNIPKGADDIGLEYDHEGIKVDQNFLTNVENVYAVGDVNGQCLMGSVAISQGIRAALHILGQQDTTKGASYEGLARAIFTIPEIAGAGLQEWELKEKGINYQVTRHPFSRTWRGISKGYNDGFVKILADDVGRILGIWMVGRDVSEMVGLLDVLLKRELSVGEILNSFFVHPSLSEALLDAALKLI